MSDRGAEVRGERILDGDASTLTAVKLYYNGTTTEIASLTTPQRLYVTSMILQCETGGDVEVNCDSDGDADLDAGDVLFSGNVAANFSDSITFDPPFACPAGKIPKFKGAATNRNTCILMGFVTQA